MEAQELRIGNWVIVNEECQIEAIIHDAVNVSTRFETYVLDTVKPIPLTEEWLERFGFEKDEDGVWEHNQSMWSCEIGYGGSMTFKKLGLDILCPDILYVHQLQNVFWSLEEETMDGEGLD